VTTTSALPPPQPPKSTVRRAPKSTGLHAGRGAELVGWSGAGAGQPLAAAWGPAQTHTSYNISHYSVGLSKAVVDVHMKYDIN
jgi:hypothetical protein